MAMVDRAETVVLLELESPYDVESALENVLSIQKRKEGCDYHLKTDAIVRATRYIWPEARLVWRLFSAPFLGSFPLHRLQLENLKFPLSAGALAETIRATRKTLTRLELVVTQLSWKDVVDKSCLASSFKKHPMLESVVLKAVDCQHASTETELLASLATCPLIDLELSDMCVSWDPCNRLPLSFCNHPSLQKVTLRNLHFPRQIWAAGRAAIQDEMEWTEGLRMFLNCLSTCNQLHALILATALPRVADYTGICTDMERVWLPKPSLRELVCTTPILRVFGSGLVYMVAPDGQRRGLPADLYHATIDRILYNLSERLQANTTLTRLSLSIPHKRLLSFAEPLKHNQTLCFLGLRLPAQTMAPEDAANLYAEVLRDGNLTLEHLCVNGFERHRLLQYYLLLNRAGRKRLQTEDASHDEWANTLIKYSENLDVVFYFLSKNPAVLPCS